MIDDDKTNHIEAGSAVEALPPPKACLSQVWKYFLSQKLSFSIKILTVRLESSESTTRLPDAWWTSVVFFVNFVVFKREKQMLIFLSVAYFSLLCCGWLGSIGADFLTNGLGNSELAVLSSGVKLFRVAEVAKSRGGGQGARGVLRWRGWWGRRGWRGGGREGRGSPAWGKHSQCKQQAAAVGSRQVEVFEAGGASWETQPDRRPILSQTSHQPPNPYYTL